MKFISKIISAFSFILLFPWHGMAQLYDLEANLLCEALTINCLPKVQQELTILRSNTDLYLLFTNNNRDHNAKDCGFPPIDFSRNFVICVRPRSLSGCREPKIDLQLNWKKDKNLMVEMSITEYGTCFKLWPNPFWVKIPIAYYTSTVDFKISKSVRSIPDNY